MVVQAADPTQPSRHSYSRTRDLPGLQPLPPVAASHPSDLYQIVIRHSEYPPVMCDAPYTLATPFKEIGQFRAPSDSIANNYTLTARDLKMRDIFKRSLGKNIEARIIVVVPALPDQLLATREGHCPAAISRAGKRIRTSS
ncbi:dynein axonemal heavy chain 3-like [Babylonia areolata]|uniref:dynein axonemal heavy chain 3-like n=1 Tax=Babylonia areolata TaxID=304850 RepID=UPI003FD21F0F